MIDDKNDRFPHERQAFRCWLANKNLNELELLKNDIELKMDYLKNGSKNMNDEFKKIIDAGYPDDGRGLE